MKKLELNWAGFCHIYLSTLTEMPITVALDADWVFEQFVHIFCGSVQLEMVWPKLRSTENWNEQTVMVTKKARGV